MQQFTQEGRNAVAEIAGRYGLSVDTVEHMLIAVNNGAGSMAQFNCPELGGSGQWMRGGMTMVGDMFNHNLKATVDRLCNELSQLLNNTQVFPVVEKGHAGSGHWWPAELGTPISSGSQNNTRYAVFTHRLAVEVGGKVTVYDTLDHRIGGVSQQQGGSDSLTFSSQYGTVSVSSLPIVAGTSGLPEDNSNFAAAGPAANSSVQGQVQRGAALPAEQSADSRVSVSDSESSTVSEALSQGSGQSSSGEPPVHQRNEPATSAVNSSTDDKAGKSAQSQDSASDLLALIDKLAQLHGAGVLSDEEFSAKKSELLARI